MILYLDTSALVKRYFEEPHSREIIARWQASSEIVTSSVAYAEAMAAFQRKKRETEIAYDIILESEKLLRSEWQGFIRIEVNDGLNAVIERVVRKYPLHGFDAIHLASALAVFEQLPDDFLFACFDQNLLKAARAEGMETYPPGS
jgi:predicted nucleic acid-binding protein